MSARRGLRPATGALLAFVLLALSACAENAPQDTLDPAGPYARDIDRLFRPVFWIAVAVFVLVQGLLLYAIVRFRHRGEGGIPTQVHGSKRMELAWTIIPAVLLAGIAIPTVGTIFSLDRLPPGALQVNVVGWQWWWAVEYPGLDVVTANEIHIPVDQPVRFNLTSAAGKEGVIHSFWIPRLAGKQDLFPGRTTTLNMQADEPGVYPGQCTEFCGLSHANMRMVVVAHEPAEFDAWVEGQRRPAAHPPEDVQAVIGQCGACHTIGGVEGLGGVIAPDLTHLGSRQTFAGATFELNAENLARWLDDPPAMKPGAKMPDYQLTEEQIDALVAYLLGLE